MNDLLRHYLLDNFDRKATLLFQKERPSFAKKEKKADPPLALPPIKTVEAPSPAPKKVTPAEVKKDPPREMPPKEEPTGFLLEKVAPKESSSSDTLRALYKKIAPSIVLHPTPPDDDFVKQQNLAWKDQSTLPRIPIFAYNFSKTDLSFLESLAHAIDVTFDTSRVYEIKDIEAKKRWTNVLEPSKVRFILVPKSLLHKTSLITYYRENPQKRVGKLLDIPTLTLLDPAAYMQSEEEKRNLWQFLSKILKKKDS